MLLVQDKLAFRHSTTWEPRHVSWILNNSFDCALVVARGHVTIYDMIDFPLLERPCFLDESWNDQPIATYVLLQNLNSYCPLLPIYSSLHFLGRSMDERKDDGSIGLAKTGTHAARGVRHVWTGISLGRSESSLARALLRSVPELTTPMPMPMPFSRINHDHLVSPSGADRALAAAKLSV
jgi:hypothetical protein